MLALASVRLLAVSFKLARALEAPIAPLRVMAPLPEIANELLPAVLSSMAPLRLRVLPLAELMPAAPPLTVILPASVVVPEPLLFRLPARLKVLLRTWFKPVRLRIPPLETTALAVLAPRLLLTFMVAPEPTVVVPVKLPLLPLRVTLPALWLILPLPESALAMLRLPESASVRVLPLPIVPVDPVKLRLWLPLMLVLPPTLKLFAMVAVSEDCKLPPFRFKLPLPRAFVALPTIKLPLLNVVLPV